MIEKTLPKIMFSSLFLFGLLSLAITQINFIPEPTSINNSFASQESVLYHGPYRSDKSIFELAYKIKDKIILPQGNRVNGLIVPHHLLASGQIAASFLALEKLESKPKTVIIIGPNHYNLGKNDILTSIAIWETPFGEILPNKELSKKISSEKIINIEESPFDYEHSISAITPFVKKSLPEAKIIPLILKSSVDLGQAQKLALVLSENISSDTLIILSMDFSHGLPSRIAEFHDDRSVAGIKNFNFNSIYSLDIDSPPALATFLYYLKNKNAQTIIYPNRSDSFKITNDSENETTSYFTGFFIDGDKEESQTVTLLALGDLMVGRYVGTLINRFGRDYSFQKLSDFLRSADFTLVNLEGPVTGLNLYLDNDLRFNFDPTLLQTFKNNNISIFNLANNHTLDQGLGGFYETQENLQRWELDFFGNPSNELTDFTLTKFINSQKVTFLGLNLASGKIDLQKTKKMVSDLSFDSFVIASIHWGVEYQSNQSVQQRKIAQELIDAGVEVIFGHHPHVIQGIEIYKNKPIFYSLGNFIFDQYFSLEVQKGLAVGLSLSQEKMKFYLFLIQNNKSQPILISGEEEKRLLNDLAQKSDIVIQAQIKEGTIELPR